MESAKYYIQIVFDCIMKIELLDVSVDGACFKICKHGAYPIIHGDLYADGLFRKNVLFFVDNKGKGQYG